MRGEGMHAPGRERAPAARLPVPEGHKPVDLPV
jgi:hypothetical protein